MQNKKKILFSSIVTIAICFCLITGSTFALFTSESDLNIAITSGNVKLTASISAVDLWSIRALNDGETAETYDEYNHGYKFQEQQNGTFANGGTAALANGNELTLSRVTPGDKVRLTISGDNQSDVITKVRYTVSCTAGEALLDALVIRLVLADGTTKELTLEGGNKFVSDWETLEIDANNVGEDMTDAVIEIELPANTNNDYQHDNLVAADPTYTGVELLIHVEAVQGNGIID